MPTQVWASGWEPAEAGEQEQHARPAFHPPQGWSLAELEFAARSSLSVDESLEKMEPSKMAPPKNAPRDALVSAREAGSGTPRGVGTCEAGQTESLAGGRGWLACHLQPGDVARKGQWGSPVSGAPSWLQGSPSKALPRGFVSLAPR